jgi:hypothetical protein
VHEKLSSIFLYMPHAYMHIGTGLAFITPTIHPVIVPYTGTFVQRMNNTLARRPQQSILTARGDPLKRPPHFSNLPGQGNHLAERIVVTRLHLSKLHVGTLQTLVQHFHDLGRNIADVRILVIGVSKVKRRNLCRME